MTTEHPTITWLLEPYRTWQAEVSTAKRQVKRWQSRLVGWFGLFFGGACLLPFLAKVQDKTPVLTAFGLVAIALAIVGIATLRAETLTQRLQRASDLRRRHLTAPELVALASVSDLPASFRIDLAESAHTGWMPNYFVVAATLQAELARQHAPALPPAIRPHNAKAFIDRVPNHATVPE